MAMTAITASPHLTSSIITPIDADQVVGITSCPLRDNACYHRRGLPTGVTRLNAWMVVDVSLGVMCNHPHNPQFDTFQCDREGLTGFDSMFPLGPVRLVATDCLPHQIILADRVGCSPLW